MRDPLLIRRPLAPVTVTPLAWGLLLRSSVTARSRVDRYHQRDHRPASRAPRLARLRAGHRLVALLQGHSRRRRVLYLVKEVRVDPERRRRARVPELAGDEHHVEPLGDEE